MKLVIMGAPSCGKGVQAKLIEDNFGLQHISTGQILRDFVKENADKGKKISETMNKGGFIKDSLMCKIVADKLSKLQNNYILDGFPRTKKQTKYLLEHFCPDMVIYLQTEKQVALDRVTSRVVCPVCKKSYNKKDYNNSFALMTKKNLLLGKMIILKHTLSVIKYSLNKPNQYLKCSKRLGC